MNPFLGGDTPAQTSIYQTLLTFEYEVTGEIPRAQSCNAHRTSTLTRIAVWGVVAWLCVVQRVLLARWRLSASSRGVVWGTLVTSVVGAGVRYGRRCQLRCRLGWCTRRAFMARQGSVLEPVYVGVCCAGGLPAGRCRLFCIVFPVLGVCVATYSVHAL